MSAKKVWVLNTRLPVAVAIWVFFLSALPASGQAVWSLERAVNRALEVSPEISAANAANRAQEGLLRQAGAWPNPELSVSADNSIGKEDGQGGADLTEVAITQSLPTSGRLGRQREVAAANLKGTEAALRYQRALVESRAASTFHDLQLARETLALTKLRLEAAHKFQKIGHLRERSGDLSRLERLRLDMIREEAWRAVATATGNYNEALAAFRAYMAVSGPVQPVALTPLSPPDPLEALQGSLANHPQVTAASYQVKSARAEINLARSGRYPDLELSLFAGRDYLGNERQSIAGASVALPLPLWDRKSGLLTASRAKAERAEFELQALRRDLNSRLRLSHLHLQQVIEQAQTYRARMLSTAQEVFDKAGKGYAAGEVEILALIDANDTYFEAQSRYLSLLHSAWREASELRLISGRSLLPQNRPTVEGTQP